MTAFSKENHGTEIGWKAVSLMEEAESYFREN